MLQSGFCTQVPSSTAGGAGVTAGVGAGGAGGADVGATTGVVVPGAAVVGVGAAEVVDVVVDVVDGVGTLSPTSLTSAHAEKTSLQHCRLPMVASQLSAALLPELQKPPQYQLLHHVFCGPDT